MFADLTIFFDVSFTDRGGTVYPSFFIHPPASKASREVANVL